MRENVKENDGKELEQDSLQYYKEESIKMAEEIENLEHMEMIYGFIKELHDNK